MTHLRRNTDGLCGWRARRRPARRSGSRPGGRPRRLRDGCNSTTRYAEQFSSTYDPVLLGNRTRSRSSPRPGELRPEVRRPRRVRAEGARRHRHRSASRTRSSQGRSRGSRRISAPRGDTPRPPVEAGSNGARSTASLATGAIIAYLVIQSPQNERFSTVNGQWVARADLDLALSNQLASDPIPGSAVQHRRELQVEERRSLPHVPRKGSTAGRWAGMSRRWRVADSGGGECPEHRRRLRTGGYQQAGAQMPAAVLAPRRTQLRASRSMRKRKWQPASAAGEKLNARACVPARYRLDHCADASRNAMRPCVTTLWFARCSARQVSKPARSRSPGVVAQDGCRR